MAQSQVHAALQAEAAGNNDRRAEFLVSALRVAPDLAQANWHLGRVQHSGKWLSLDEAQRGAASDPQLEEYHKLRQEAGENPKLLRGLARWCLKNDWNEAAKLHYAQLLSSSGADLDAKQEAIRRLGLIRLNGQWMTAEEWDAQQQQAKAVEEALTKWRPPLKRLQTAIDGGDFGRREKAMKELGQLTDPQIIPVLESFLVDGQDRFQEQATKKLATFPHYEAASALAYYAVLSPYLSAREPAAKALKSRSVFEYAPLLLGALVAPLETQFQVSTGRRDQVFYRHAVRQQTPQLDRVAIADTISIPITFTPRVSRGPEATILQREFKSLEVGALQTAAQAVELQAAAANASARSKNRRVIEALQTATGQQLGEQPQAWWDWWQDYNQKWWPQISQCIYNQQQRIYPTGPQSRHSCFVAGTLVRTETGLTPVEAIRPGDRVLSQDPDSGELSFKLVSATTVRPPAAILRIKVSGGIIETTLGHPFWVDGKGWRMAKELQSGDSLHSLSGATPIETIEDAGDKKVAHNLVVNEFNTYFVGQQGLLVQDNEFRKPTQAIVPGLIAEQGDPQH
jgi:hypothetical protein